MQAAHLIGFQASHKCLGNNIYEVTFVIYRDCNSNGAPFDSPMQCAIYKSAAGDTTLYGSFQASPNAIEMVAGASNGLPGCIEKATYVKQLNLPPGRYTVVYQRCCLASDILNILLPENNGFTVYTDINADNGLCNATPQVATLPFFAKIFEPFTFSPLVTETDGDSLRFDLCGIYNGGGPLLLAPEVTGCDGAQPNPPCAPPYNLLAYANPYSDLAPFDSDPAVTLDPLDGTLTFTPQKLGRFLVGLCISEYRNDTLIGTGNMAFLLTVTDDLIIPVKEAPDDNRAFHARSNGDFLQITWENDRAFLKNIDLFDNTGRLLSATPTEPPTTQALLPLNGTPNGIIFLRATWSDGKTSAKTFVKD